MTPEDQRIALAEVCGWKWWQSPVANTNGFYVQMAPECPNPSFEPYIDRPGVFIWSRSTEDVPHYLKDLNAIHVAWQKCIQGNPILEDDFSVELLRAVGVEEPSDCSRPNGSDAEWALASNATAPQRCEALLRTIGKWEDPE